MDALLLSAMSGIVFTPTPNYSQLFKTRRLNTFTPYGPSGLPMDWDSPCPMIHGPVQ